MRRLVAESIRRAILGLVAAGLTTGSFVQTVLADAKWIKLDHAAKIKSSPESEKYYYAEIVFILKDVLAKIGQGQ